MSSEEYPQNMNCIFCNDSQKQNISLSKSHPKVIIQIIPNNRKNNAEHGKLHDYRQVRKCSLFETFSGHFFICRLIIAKLRTIL